MAVRRVIGAVEERMRAVRRLEKEEERRRKKASERSSLIKAQIKRMDPIRGATTRAVQGARRREKERLMDDIVASLVAGEPTGRFAATQPEIRNFAISEEQQLAQPGEFAYIKPSHLKKLREKGVRRVSIEGGGISPSAKVLNTLRLLQDGQIPVEEADPNELLGQLGRLGQPPALTTDQAQEIMRTGRLPEQTEGRQFMQEPIFTPGQREDLRGLYGQFEPTPLEQPETDLTQWAQQYVGEPQPATPPQNIQALWQSLQAEGGAKQKPTKLITVFKTDKNAVGPRTMRVPDVGGHPPAGYEFKEERTGGTMKFGDAEQELKRRTRGGGGGIGGRPGEPLVEGDERLTPPGPGANEEEWARYYWELARMRMRGASAAQIAAEARRLAAQHGMQIG